MEATRSTVPCPLSYDWAPLPSASGRGYYISRTDGGMKRKRKGGWTDQKGPSGRLTQTREVPLLCEEGYFNSFSLAPHFSLCISFLGVHTNVTGFYSKFWTLQQKLNFYQVCW